MLQGRRCLWSLPTGTSDQSLSDLLSRFWIQLDYYWEDTTNVLSSLETLSRFSKLELSLICSYHFFLNIQFGCSCTDTLFVYLWSDSSCEVPSLNAKHLWNMGHFVVQVDLPWILCSLCRVIMISKFYHSHDFWEHAPYLNRVHEDELSSQITYASPFSCSNSQYKCFL